MADERSQRETDGPDAGSATGVATHHHGEGENGPDRELLAWLIGRDVWCPACRYNLRGLQTDRCPECGIAFELGLKASTPGFKAWVFALIATSMGVATSFLFVTGALHELIVYQGWSAEDQVIGAICATNFLAGSVYTILLVRQRARIWQRPNRKLVKHLAAAALIALVPLAIVVFIILYLA